MKCAVFFIISVFFTLMTTIAFTHPVIWKDGTVINSKFSTTINEMNIHYSFTNKLSLGFHGIKLDNTAYGMVQINTLFKRWNKKNSQGNLYTFSGIGKSLHTQNSLISHLGIQGDWETRRVYTFLSINSYFTNNPIHSITARFGLAPYLAKYNDISTWIILQGNQHIQNKKNQLTIMPLLRFFKNNILVELGSNFTDKYFITTMVHL